MRLVLHQAQTSAEKNRYVSRGKGRESKDMMMASAEIAKQAKDVGSGTSFFREALTEFRGRAYIVHNSVIAEDL